MKLSTRAMAIEPSVTLSIDAKAKNMKADGLDVVGFGAGEPDFDTPDYIKEAGKEAIEKGMTKYTPAAGTVALKQAVVDRMDRKYGIKFEPAQVVISNGAKHSLYNIFHAILNPGDEVIIVSPFWVTYPELVKMALGKPVFVEASKESGFVPSVSDIEKAITKNTKAIIVNSPSNPCGCVYDKATLEGIAKLAIKNEFFIIADEIYDELDYDNSFVPMASISEEAKDLTFVVNGVSKAYSMTGWRIGYTICPTKEIAGIMGSYQSHATSNPSSISQHASLAALNGSQEDLSVMLKAFDARRKLMHDIINSIPNASSLLPKGAFYTMMDVSKLMGKKYKGEVVEDTLKFTELLLKDKLVAAVPGEAFGCPGLLRLSYATSEENIKKGLGRIAEFCAEFEV